MLVFARQKPHGLIKEMGRLYHINMEEMVKEKQC